MRMLFLLLFCLPFSAFSQSLFSDVSTGEAERVLSVSSRPLPERYRMVRAEMEGLRHLLSGAPVRFSREDAGEEWVAISVPLPDGNWGRYRVMESPVMPSVLQAKYPEIRTYVGVGLDDPSARLYCDVSPQGFHAMVLSERHEAVFLDACGKPQDGYGVVYFRSALKRPSDWTCAVDGQLLPDGRLSGDVREWSGDCQLRRYRLALGCTGEYAQFHGGTKSLALAAMVTTLHRVNGIYERELGIRMELAPNNDTLIFLDPATDGYSNSDIFAMLLQHANKCNALIGPDNYDIGHVLSTGPGGAASLGSVCNNSAKARGATGSSTPFGDAFDVDYVAHEMGHQFGANHTHNNNCARNIATAVEPGSGSTIMGYAGLCPPNLQSNSDAYFHGLSIEEIRQYTTAGPGNVCPQKINVGNSAPNVTVLGGSAFVIPSSTPFELTAVGTEPNGDALTYCWEQMDAQVAPMPPLATNAVGPMFRSFAPTSSPQRYFPALEHILSNTQPTWERLPAVGRTMRFRVTARDNHVDGGCSAFAEALVSVSSSAGPFAVLEPNVPITWYVGETQKVRWDVANTDAAPVSCSEVRILLSTDGGWTYPYVLAGAVSNVGEAEVQVPLILSDSCRVRVQAVGNVFFDVSDQMFRIELPPVPSFVLEADFSHAVQQCSADTLAFWVQTQPLAGFEGEVFFAVSGLPAGTEAIISPNPAAVGDSVRIAIPPISDAGVYALTLRAQGDTIVRERSWELKVVSSQPEAPVLKAPWDGLRGVLPVPTLQWSGVDDALKYWIQVSAAPSFNSGNLVWSEAVNDSATTVSSLQPGTVYYWRVRAENACGFSDFTETWAFQTAISACGIEVKSPDVPKAIGNPPAPPTLSTLVLQDGRALADVDVWLSIRHTWVGDLRARLIGPDSTSALLFSRPGLPYVGPTGCPGDDLALTLNDDALLTPDDLHIACNTASPAIAGTFQPMEHLAAFQNRAHKGIWALEVRDLEEDDDGQLEAWGLRLCFWDTVPALLLLRNDLLLAPESLPIAIENSLLAIELGGADAAEGRYTLLSLPQHGQLLLNGTPLDVGNTFTQADIDARKLIYRHSGDDATADAFLFDAQNTASGQWLHSAIFSIEIVKNDLLVYVELLDSLLCYNDNNARLLAQAKGGKPPYSYQLAGSNEVQSDGIFKDLGPGVYAVVVRDSWGFYTTSAPITIINPDSIVVLVYVSHDSVWVSAMGGRPPYTYSIDGSIYQGEELFTDLPNGIYTVTVADAVGCTGTATAVISVDVLAIMNIEATPARCPGSSDGTAHIFVDGGVPPYLYSINGVDFQKEPAFSGLSGGGYVAVVLDKNGNTATQTFFIDEPPVITIETVIVLNSIEITAKGGTGTFTYSLNGGPFQPEPVFKDLPNGIYSVVVRDANGCTAETTAQIDVLPLQILSVETGGDILCAGGTVSVSVRVSGGIPPYTYSLDGGAFQADSIWSAVSAGVHYIVVRDAADSIAVSDTFFIVEPLPLLVTHKVLGPKAYFSVEGGTPPYLFSLNGSTWASDSVFSDLSNGLHFVIIADNNFCSDTIFFEVNYSPLAAIVTKKKPSCYGSKDGAFTIEIIGGVPPFMCGGQLLSDNVCERSSLGGGLYGVLLTDALNDSLWVIFSLESPPAIDISVSVVGNTIAVSATGGTGALMYSIDGQNFQNSPVFENLPDGLYEITVRDANGCTAVYFKPVEIKTSSTVEPGSYGAIKVYPNPSRGHFWIEWPRSIEGDCHLVLCDGRGAVVRELVYSDRQGTSMLEITLEGLPSGMYMLSARDALHQYATRILITSGSF